MAVGIVTPVEPSHMPKHVGIIMDGNGRWATQRGRPRVFGHKNGVLAVQEVVRAAGEWGISSLTLFAFSSENWTRPMEEVGIIMGLLEAYLVKELDQLDQNNVKLCTIGEVDRLSPKLRQILDRAINRLSKNNGLTLNLALSYGGRSEILFAFKELASKIENNQLSISDVTEQEFGRHLYSPESSDLDLLIRTSGEQRLSNFMLWQSAYAELVFSPVLWPDYRRVDFESAVQEFARRSRRFGGVDSINHVRQAQSSAHPC